MLFSGFSRYWRYRQSSAGFVVADNCARGVRIEAMKLELFFRGLAGLVVFNRCNKDLLPRRRTVAIRIRNATSSGKSFKEDVDAQTQSAAIRELREETGIEVLTVGGPVEHRDFSLLLPSSETVLAVEQYLVLHAPSEGLSRAGWTQEETEVMADHRWWSAESLRGTDDQILPERLDEMLVNAGIFESAR